VVDGLEDLDVELSRLGGIEWQTQSEYDFGKLHEVVQVLVHNLNKIIDINYYPVPEAKKTQLLGNIGGSSQGTVVDGLEDLDVELSRLGGIECLADAFLALRLPFDSPEARQLNIQIFETIYHGALTDCCGHQSRQSWPSGRPSPRDRWECGPTCRTAGCDSPEARQLNIQIFETIYHGALTASSDIAKKLGPYETRRKQSRHRGRWSRRSGC
jgi:ribonucleotide reductase alpha subunit